MQFHDKNESIISNIFMSLINLRRFFKLSKVYLSGKIFVKLRFMQYFIYISGESYIVYPKILRSRYYLKEKFWSTQNLLQWISKSINTVLMWQKWSLLLLAPNTTIVLKCKIREKVMMSIYNSYSCNMH